MQMYFRIRHFDRYVGALVVLAVTLAMVALVFVARGEKWFAKRTPYKVIFSKVQGLKPGTPVTISGMEVGHVKSLHLAPQSKVELTLEVLQQYRENIRQDSQATVAMALLGGKTIEVSVGSPNRPLIPEWGIIPSEEPREIADLLKGVDLKASWQKLDDALENLKSITAKLNNPRGELFTVLKHLEFVTSQLKNGEGNVGAFLQDPKMHGEIHAAIASLRRSLSQVEEATQNASKFSRDLPRVTEEVDRAAKEVPKILAEVKNAASKLPPILDDLKKTASHTPGIAENLQDITKEGKVIVRDVKEITGSMKKDPPQIPDLLASTQETVEDADKLILGLQNHWLLRGSMPKVKGEMPLAVSQRESPYEKRGEINP